MNDTAFLKLKRKLGIIVNRSILRDPFEKMNLIFFHWHERGKWIRRDLFDNKKFYVVKGRGDTEGLISIYFYVMNGINTALTNGFIPVVDLRENCQYLVNRRIDGSDNAWDYYFQQPCGYNTEDLDTAKNVYIEGWRFKNRYQGSILKRDPENAKKGELRAFCNKYLKVKKSILDQADSKYQTLFSEIDNVLGVYIRGTDYAELKPVGHFVQPSIDDVISKIEEFLNNNTIDKIYLVTEDFSYYTKLKNKFGDLIVVSDDDFVKEYSGKDYLSFELNADPYSRGYNYLIRLILLSKCSFIISSITNGSLFSRILMEKEPKKEYWFELGKYGIPDELV